MKTTKKIFTEILFAFLVIYILSVFYSCSDDTASNNGGPVYYTITGFTGKVHYLPDSSRSILSLMTKDSSNYTMGSGTVGADSMMSINLSTPTAGMLMPVAQLFTQLTGGTITISDQGANVNFVNMDVYATGGTTQYRGVITKANNPTSYSPQVGNIFMTYLYSDRPVTAEVNSIRMEGVDTIKTNVSLNLTTGYNQIYNKITALRSNYMEVQVISGEPSGTEWYFIAIAGDRPKWFKN